MSVLRGIRSLIKSASGFSKNESVRDFASKHPLSTFGLVAPTAGFAASEIAAPIVGGAAQALDPGIGNILSQAIDEEGVRFNTMKQTRSEMISKNLRDQRMKEMIERNMAIVARRDPHLFNQVMSGRVLPQGAVVLGGPRRQDLMEELAYAMGTSSSPEEFSSLLA